MKNYLIEFRDQVFGGAMSLYKRIFLSYILLNIVIGVLAAAVLIPLMLKFLGWDISFLLNLQDTMKEMNQQIIEGADPGTLFGDLVTEMHFEYLIPVLIIGLLYVPWSINLYYSLNDNEIRNSENGILKAIRKSFSINVFRMLALIIVYYLLMLASLIIFFFLISLLMAVSKALGIIVGFVGFFFLIFFLVRFAIAPAAMSHGNMGMGQAFSYSYSKITMKRAALLTLMFIVIIVILGICSSISSVIVNAVINRNNADPMTYLMINQIFSKIFGAITGAFLYAGSSALYFRYSEDVAESEAGDHLVEDQNRG